MLFTDPDLDLVKTWINDPKIAKFELIYKASVDGFQAAKFHANCDDKGPTISFITSEFNKVCGGFTTLSWKGGEYCADPNAFIFSLTHKTKHTQYQNHNYAMYINKTYSVTFGGGHDLHVANPTDVT